ncbi:MAG: energy transducer TonB [Desulfopila sp.]
MPVNEWKLPLNLALGFHLLIALAVVYLPHLFHVRAPVEEVYTVDLINIASEPAAKAAPSGPETVAKPAPRSEPAPPKAAPKPVKNVPPPEPVVQPKNVIALNEPKIVEPVPMSTASNAEAVSIKPLKRKVKSEIVAEPDQPPVKPEPDQAKPEPDRSQLERQQLAQRIRTEQRLAEIREKAVAAEKKAAEEARIAAEEAELERRLAEATANRMKAAATASAGAATADGRSSQPTALEKQYYAAIMARIQEFWSLPEYRKWDPALKATVIITVDKDGRIAGSYFESHSVDTTFDRFATKALQDVGYLPPIPAAIRKDRLEIGLNFTPGGIR